jgi:hypothetical protein
LNFSAAILAFVAPAMTLFKADQGPPPPDPHSTLKLLAVCFIFILIAAGAISSVLTSPKEKGDQDDAPK